MKIIDDIMKFVMGPSAGASQEAVAALPSPPLVDDEPGQITLFDDALQNGAYFFDQSVLADYSSDGDPTLGTSSIALQANAWQQAGIATSQTVTAETRYLELDLYRVDGASGVLTVRAGSNWAATNLDASNYGTAWSVEGVETFESLAALPADVWQHITVDLVSLLGEGATFKAITVFGDRDGGENYFMDNVVLSEGDASSDIIYIDDSYSSFTGTDADEHIISIRTTGGIIIDGGGGDDIIESDGVGNFLAGGDGNDTLINTGTFGYFDAGAGSGDGNGDDTYITDENGAWITYDRGSTINIQVTGATFTASVGDNGETDTLTNINNLLLSNVDDTFSVAEGGSFTGFSVDGNTGNDTLSGGSLGDILSGNIGDDTLSGNGGDDILRGGNDDDVMTGGTGADIFILENNYRSESDIITDFSTEDALGLFYADFNFIGTDTFTGVQNEIRYRHDGNDTIIELDFDGDGLLDTTARLEGYSGDLSQVTDFDYSNTAASTDFYDSNFTGFLVAADPVDPPPPSGNELVLFDDALQNGAYFFDRSVLAELSGESDPALNTSSIALHSDAWQQSGIASTQTVTAETRYLELDLYRVEGSGGSLKVRAGSNWAATTLDASNYGTAWSVEGVETFEGLAALPSDVWQHITIDLLTLLGDGATFRAITVFGDRDGGERYFMDNVILTDTVGGGSANAAPVAVNDMAAIETGPQAILDVLINDTDSDEDALAITHINGVELGLNETRTLADGAIAENLGTSIGLTAIVAGDISLNYTVSDGELSDTATVDVTVTGNRAPIAVDDAYSVLSGHPIIVDLTYNDTDPDGDSLRLLTIEGPKLFGTNLISVGDGHLFYQDSDLTYFIAAADYEGDFSFTYSVQDTAGAIDEATVTFSITPNSEPIAQDDNFTMRGGSSLQLDLLGNDIDADGDILSLFAFNGITIDDQTPLLYIGDEFYLDYSSGTFTAYPASDFEGDVSFTYSVIDGAGGIDEASVTISVTPNTAPIAEDILLPAIGGHRYHFTPSDIAYDLEGDYFLVSHINGQEIGLVETIDLGDGHQIEHSVGFLSYTAAPNFDGDFSFTYTVTDQYGGSTQATLTASITPNSAPMAVDDFFNMIPGTNRIIYPQRNDIDADEEYLTLTHINGQELFGEMIFNLGDGNQVVSNYGYIIVSAGPEFEGEFSFSYTVNDFAGESDEGIVTVLAGPNIAPTAHDDMYTAVGGHPELLPLNRNDIDPEGAFLEVTHINEQEVDPFGVLLLEGGHQLDFSIGPPQLISPPDFEGDVTFTYTINDGDGGTDEGTATVSVTPNTAPISEDYLFNILGGTNRFISPLLSASDADGDTVSISHINGQLFPDDAIIDLGNGNLLINLISGHYFVASPNYEGEVEFSFTVTDSYGSADIANAIVSVELEISDSIETLGSIEIGESVNSEINFVGDRDWFAVEMIEGERYIFTLSLDENDPENYGYLRLHDETNTLVSEPGSRNYSTRPEIGFVADATATYYISAGSYDDSIIGGYTLTLEQGEPLTEWSAHEVAEYLISGSQAPSRWADTDITYNIEGVTEEYQSLAELAFQTWDDISGLTFTRTTGVAEITVGDEDESETYTSKITGAELEDGYIEILGAEINVYYGINAGDASINSYHMQRFLHQIGHAIGLEHAGPYESPVTYGVDNIYLNDSWSMSVMSHIHQHQAGEPFIQVTISPQLADVVAVQQLYGPDSVGARTGDTVYGFNSTESDQNNWEMMNHGIPPSMAIVDDGGNDTIDLTDNIAPLNIILEGGEYSSWANYSNLFSIAFGTIIENVIGGMNNDILTGNIYSNVLRGGLGADTLDGVSDTAGLAVDTYLYDGTLAEINSDTLSMNSGDLLSFFFEDGASEVDLTFWIDTDAFSGTAGEIRWQNDAGSTIIEYDRDGDGTANGSMALGIDAASFILEDVSATGFIVSVVTEDTTNAMNISNDAFTFDNLPEGGKNPIMRTLTNIDPDTMPQSDDSYSTDDTPEVSEWIHFDDFEHFLI